MPTYANEDAEYVAHGIRLGGRGHLIDAAPDGYPITIEYLERLSRPDLYEPDEDGSTPVPGETGLLRAYQSDTHTIACDWYGWLPGHYTTRQAALTAYGYILGGEDAGPLDKLTQPRPDGYTLAEIVHFAATSRD